VAKGGIEPPTHGFSVAIYVVKRCTNEQPSLVEARQDSPNVLRFPYIFSSDRFLDQGKSENFWLLRVPLGRLQGCLVSVANRNVDTD
jgi:hypothetical protein